MVLVEWNKDHSYLLGGQIVTNFSMSSVPVRVADIASLLTNDLMLFNDWRYFYAYLSPVVDRTNDIQAKYNQHPNTFSLFKCIIEQWVSENEQEAITVQKLADILKSTNYLATRGTLLDRFPPSAIISFDGSNSRARMSTNATLQYDENPDIADERKYVDSALQRKTQGGGVTIMELMAHKKQGEGRVLVFVNFLLQKLDEIGDRPVVIVSINGKQRRGKSFLANQFVKYLMFHNELEGEPWLDEDLEGSFTWRDGVDRVTSGIQIWHKPLYVNCNGKEVAVIILDTQGLHDAKTGSQENAIIFGLSILLSSVFIYNERDAADDSLQYLRSFLEFAKFASGGDQGSSSTQSEGHLKFQKLILLLRDWQSETQYPYDYYDDTHGSPNLKEKLLGTTELDMHAEAKETRRGIANSFEYIAVNAMCGPGNKRPDNRQSCEWEPDFRKSVVAFVTKIFSADYLLTSVKKVFGEEVSGKQLIDYVSNWATLIQSAEGVVESKTIFETTAEIYYNKKMDEYLGKYKLLMEIHLNSNTSGIQEHQLNNYHELQIAGLLADFGRNRPFGGESTQETYRGKLLERINGVKEDFVRLNQANLTAEEERLLRERERVENERREAELRRQREEAKNLAISTAADRYQQAMQDLSRAQGKRDNVISNQQSYKTPVNMKKRNRVFGIVSSPTTWVEWRYDDQKYQAALKQANDEVEEMSIRVTAAEESLQAARNS